MSGKSKTAQIETANPAEALVDSIEDVRVNLAVARDRHAEMQGRAVSREEAEARVNDWCSQLRAAMLDRMDVLRFTSPVYRPPALNDAQMIALGVVSEDIRADLIERIGEAYKGFQGVTEADRKATILKLEGDVLDLEIAEERIIRTAEAAGLQILRRANAMPVIVLATDASLAGETGAESEAE